VPEPPMFLNMTTCTKFLEREKRLTDLNMASERAQRSVLLAAVDFPISYVLTWMSVL
jgi:hypothetical protein